MNDGESVWMTLLKAVAAIAPMAVVLYYSDPSFKREVDRSWEVLRYRARLGAWKARTWDRWQGWQRELWESRHGPLEG